MIFFLTIKFISFFLPQNINILYGKDKNKQKRIYLSNKRERTTKNKNKNRFRFSKEQYHESVSDSLKWNFILNSIRSSFTHVSDSKSKLEMHKIFSIYINIQYTIYICILLQCRVTCYTYKCFNQYFRLSELIIISLTSRFITFSFI